jgi:WD40 repeat protein
MTPFGLALLLLSAAQADGPRTYVPQVHLDSVKRIAVNADESLVATVGDRRVLLWSGSTLQPLGSISSGVVYLDGTFHPGTGDLVVLSRNRVERWNLRTRSLIASKNVEEADLFLSEDGSLIYGLRDQRLFAVDAVTMAPVREGKEKLPVVSISEMRFSEDGRTLAFRSVGRGIFVYDALDFSPKLGPVPGQEFALSPDGTQLAVAEYMGKLALITVGNKARTELEPSPPGTGLMGITDLMFVHGGRSILAGGIGGMTTWDIESKKQAVGSSSIVDRLRLWRRGTEVLEAKEGSVPATRKLPTLERGPFLPRLHPVMQLDFTPNGKELIATESLGLNDYGGGADFVSWGLEDHQVRWALFGDYASRVFQTSTGEQARLAVKDGRIETQTVDGTVRREGGLLQGFGEVKSGVRLFALNHGAIAAVDLGSSLHLFEASSGKALAAPKPEEGKHVLFAAEERGSRLALFISDLISFEDRPHEFVLWDAKLGRESLRVKRKGFQPEGAQFDPSGNSLWIWQEDRLIRLSLPELAVEFDEKVANSEVLALERLPKSPFGVVMGSQGDVSLWNLATKEMKWRIAEPADRAECAALHPNGRMLVLGSATGRISFRNMDDGSESISLYGFSSRKSIGGVDFVAIAKDGRFDASPEAMNLVTVARGLTVLTGEERLERVSPGLLATALGAALGPNPPSSVGAPTVRLVEPAEGAVVYARQIPVTVQAFQQDGKVVKTEIAVNGRVAVIEDRGRETSGAETLRTYWVSLDPGANRIMTTATNGYGVAKSVEVSVRNSAQETTEGRPEVEPQTGTPYASSDMAFSPDGRFLATVAGGTVCLWRTSDGAQIRTLTGMPNFSDRFGRFVAFSPDGKALAVNSRCSRAYSGDGLTNPDFVTIWDVRSGRLEAILTRSADHDEDLEKGIIRPELLESQPALRWFLKRPNRRPGAREPVTGENVKVTGEDGRLRIETNGRSTFLPYAFTPIRFSADESTIAGRLATGKEALLDLRNRTLVALADHTPLELGGVRVVPGSSRLLLSTLRGPIVWDLASGSLSPLPMPEGGLDLRQIDRLSSLEPSADGSRVFIGDWGQVTALDLKNGSSRRYSGFDFPAISVDVAGERLLTIAFDSRDGSEDLKVRKQSLLLFEGNSAPKRLAVSGEPLTARFAPDGRFWTVTAVPRPAGELSLGSVDRNPTRWSSLPNGEFHGATFRILSPNGEAVDSFPLGAGRLTMISLFPRHDLVLAGFDDGRVEAWCPSEKRLRWVSPTTRVAARSLAFDANQGLIAAGFEDGTVRLFDLAQGTYQGLLWGHSRSVQSLGWLAAGKRLVTQGFDRALRIWDVPRRELVATLLATSDRDGVIIDSKGNYLCSKFALPIVRFRVGDRALPFDTFDLEKNRPDLVLQALGFSTEAHIRELAQAREKRLRHQRIASSKGDAPSLVLTSRSEEAAVVLQVRAASATRKIQRIRASVNGVPFGPIEGHSVSPEAQVSFELRVPLSHGANRIRISAVDDALGESAPEVLEVFRGGDPPLRTLHVLAVGVSNYANPKLNLKYAAVDAWAVIEAFGKVHGGHEAIRPLPLLDAEAKREDILTAARALENVREDDTVVVFLAGHGAVSESQEFYFVAHDTDVGKLKETGLAFEQIERLLERCPSRRKLLVMDACQSGVLDPEGVWAPLPVGIAETADPKRNVEVASRIFRVSSSFDAMRAQFADLDENSGALVLSAAAGSQFAFERDGNGLFTRALIDGIERMAADRDGNGELAVTELQDYVSKIVRERSGGRQVPTFRRDVIDRDFTLVSASGLVATLGDAAAPFLPSRSIRDLLEGDRIVFQSPGVFQNQARKAPFGEETIRLRNVDLPSGPIEFQLVVEEPSGKVRFQIPVKDYDLQRGRFSGDGRFVAVLTAQDAESAEISVISLRDGRKLRSWKAKQFENGFLSHDGSSLVLVTRGRVELFSVASGSRLFERELSVGQVGFDPRGSVAVLPFFGLDGAGGLLWVDPRSGRVLRETKAHGRGAYCASFSGDGKLLATGGDDGAIVLWDALGGDLLASVRGSAGTPVELIFRGQNEVLSMDWVDAVNGAGGSRAYSLWQIAHLVGRPPAPCPLEFCRSQLYTEAPAGKTEMTALIALAVAGPSFAPPPTTPIFTIDPGNHVTPVMCMVDRSGDWLVTAGEDRAIRIWELPTGKLFRTVYPPLEAGLGGQTIRAAFSPNGQLVAVGTLYLANWLKGHAVYVFSRETGEMVHRFDELPSAVWGLAFSAKGDRLAIGLSSELRVVDLAGGPKPFWLDKDFRGAVFGLEFDRSGRLAVGCDDGSLRLYGPGMEVLARVETRPRVPREIRFSPDGNYLAVGDSDLGPVEIRAAKDLRRLFTASKEGVRSGGLDVPAWSPAGRYLAAGYGGQDEKGRFLLRIYDRGGPGASSRRTPSIHLEAHSRLSERVHRRPREQRYLPGPPFRKYRVAHPYSQISLFSAGKSASGNCVGTLAADAGQRGCPAAERPFSQSRRTLAGRRPRAPDVSIEGAG